MERLREKGVAVDEGCLGEEEGSGWGFVGVYDIGRWAERKRGQGVMRGWAEVGRREGISVCGS